MAIEKTAESLLLQAHHEKASDIHIIPRKQDFLVQFRIHGKLLNIRKLPPRTGERLISHLKFLASMDISEKRKPQSGSLHMNIPHLKASLRVSTLPSIYMRESLAIRILPQQRSFSFDQMTLFPETIRTLRSLALHSHGMIIFTGPTGSGKSTSMYALADYCTNEWNRNVITLEDPVENQFDSFLQIQVNEKAGVTYSTGLKAILRHDPDVIIVGEIRDAETARIAIRAALTGHLVFSTMHSRNAAGAILRLKEFGIPQQEIEQTVIGILGQRLIPLLCPLCGTDCLTFCSAFQLPKRTAIIETLSGNALHHAFVSLDNNQSGESATHATIPKLLRKGIALGFISDQEYDRWAVREANQT